MHSHLRGHPVLLDAVQRLEHLKPDQFELFFQRRVSTSIDSKDLQVESLSRAEDVGLSVRVIQDGRLGFSFTTSLDKPSILRAIDSALEIASVMPHDPHHGFQSFGTWIYPEIDAFDSRGLAAPVSRKIDLARELEARCRGADPRVTGVRKASVAETITETHLVDSHGEHLNHKVTRYSASITCKAESGGDSQMGADFGFSNHLDSLDVAEVARRAAGYATELLGAGAAPTLRCPAIFRNGVVADLVEFLSSSFSAEEMDKGRSMLAGKSGQKLFSDAVTLVDDGLLDGGLGTSPFDGEGVPSRKTVLVDGGIVRGTLYDSYHARKHGTDPTGSSSRGIKSPPSISVSNLLMQPGRNTPERLMDGIGRGILITDLMGLHTANPVTGDFSLGASGILIENGQLTRPVRGFAVAGNVLEVFQRMSDISNDLRFFGNVGAPSARISEISVGGA